MNRRGFFGLIGSIVLGSIVVAKAKPSNIVRFPPSNLKRRDTLFPQFKQEFMLPINRITATDVANANSKFDDKTDSLSYTMGRELSRKMEKQILKVLKG